MGLTIKEELRRTFELATLRQEAKTLRTPRHWHQVSTLIDRSRALRQREERSFEERYDTRVEIARRRLMQGAGAPMRTLQPDWATLDRFSATDLLRQARREVHVLHERRIARIREAEARGLVAIVQHAKRENGLHLSLVRAFGRAVEPPDGPDPPHRTGPTRR